MTNMEALVADQQDGIEELRRLWREARSHKSTGHDPNEVLTRVARKYQVLADAAAGND